MLRCAIFLVLVVAVLARPKWHQLDEYSFDKFVEDFGRRYQAGTDEYIMREKIFNEKLVSIRAHNKDSTKTWKRGVNMFTDMTAQEWKNYNKHRISPFRQPPTRTHGAPPPEVPLPKTIDYRQWTNPRVLSNVKHQGSCGNCWAQSGVESMEAYYALLTGFSTVLSTQQMTSCTPLVYGCDGGDYAVGWDTIHNGTTVAGNGLTEEWAYPFVDFFFGKPGHTNTAACSNISTEYPAKPYTWFAELHEVGIEGHGSVKINDARAAMHALATIGPQSISVAAGNWQDYETGVMANTDKFGNSSEWGIDHAVQMVGYGVDKDLGVDYWLVRNSWSTLWGEDGYVRLLRPEVEPCSPAEFGPVCGTSGCLSDLQYPIVKMNKPRKF